MMRRVRAWDADAFNRFSDIRVDGVNGKVLETREDMEQSLPRGTANGDPGRLRRPPWSPIVIAPGPTLETARLVLRPTAWEDLDGFATLLGDPESARFIGGQQPRSMAWRAMSTMAGSWALMGFGMFSVLEKTTGRWVGRVGPYMPEGWPGREVGWGLVRECTGKGYATEAASAAMDWAFDHLGWTQVIHCIVPENTPSQEVARRLGSRPLGPVKLPAPYDATAVVAWGQSREDWRARRT